LNIFCSVSYDGFEFSGWQIQKNAYTIQETIEKVLYKIYKKEIKTIVAGRTDAGVHALKNYFNFHIEKSDIPIEKIPFVMNSYLSKSIRILETSEQAENFNSRFNAKKRIYEYYIEYGKINPFLRNYRLFYQKKLNFEKMNAGAELLLGTHNFNGFRASDCGAKNPERTVYESYFELRNNTLVYHISANAFLKNMVRIIMGTLIQVGLEKIEPIAIQEILESEKRCKAGPTITPSGLFMIDVEY